MPTVASALIENERARLLEVRCLLHCMYVTMLYDEGDALDYADGEKIFAECFRRCSTNWIAHVFDS